MIKNRGLKYKIILRSLVFLCVVFCGFTISFLNQDWIVNAADEHEITVGVNDESLGGLDVDVYSACGGEKIVLNLRLEMGCQLAGWESGDVVIRYDNAYEAYYFIMPYNKDVTITAILKEEMSIGEPSEAVIYRDKQSSVTYPLVVKSVENVELDDFYFPYYDFNSEEYSSLKLEEYNDKISYYGLSMSIEKDTNEYEDENKHFLLTVNFSKNWSNIEEEICICLTKENGVYDYYDTYYILELPMVYFNTFIFDIDDYETVPYELEGNGYMSRVNFRYNEEDVEIGSNWIAGETYEASFMLGLVNENLAFMPEENYATNEFKIGNATLVGAPYIEYSEEFDVDILYFTVEYTVPDKNKANRAVENLLGTNNSALDYVQDSASFLYSDYRQLYIFNSLDLTESQAKLIGMDKGILLSSGYSKEIFAYGGGPQQNGKSEITNERDLDLKTLLDAEVSPNEYNLYDTAVLTFKVTAKLTGTLLFRYSFASPEMDQNAQYNDIFALFARDVDGDSFENLAIMPKSKVDDPNVNITVTNLINSLKDKNFDHNETTVQFLDPVSLNGDNEMRPSKFYSELPFNGITNLYDATFKVEQGKTYELKLCISDVSDSSYDSAVFIKSGSFDIVPSQPSISTDYINPTLQGHTLAIKNEDTNLSGTIVLKDVNGNTVWESDAVNPGYSVTISEEEITEIAKNGYGLYYVYFKVEDKLSSATQFNIGEQKSINKPIDLTTFIFETQEDIDESTELQETIELLETNGGNAEFSVDDLDRLNLTLDEINLYNTSDESALKLPNNINIVVEGDTTIKTPSTAIEFAGNDTQDETISITGNATLNIDAGIIGIDADNNNLSISVDTNIKAQVGISTTGNITVSKDLVITATDCGIYCDVLTIIDGGSLIININKYGYPMSDSTKVVIPEDYIVIGGQIDQNGYLIVDENAKQVKIIKKTYVITSDLTLETKDENNGYISIDETTMVSGEIVTFIVLANDGYTLKTDSLIAKYVDGTEKTIELIQDSQDNTKYTFVMPQFDVTITAEFEKVNGNVVCQCHYLLPVILLLSAVLLLLYFVINFKKFILQISLTLCLITSIILGLLGLLACKCYICLTLMIINILLIGFMIIYVSLLDERER